MGCDCSIVLQYDDVFEIPEGRFGMVDGKLILKMNGDYYEISMVDIFSDEYDDGCPPEST